MILLEKRKYKRIDTAIQIELYFDDTVFKAETINLSLSGVYCKAIARYKYLPDKILNLVIPIPKNKDFHLIKSYGLIVRETYSTGICYAAIFFNGLINAEDKKIIKQYILAEDINNGNASINSYTGGN
ncbi:MAG: PilZ domain-containing protein [Planctomycetes bacterium]|nr:PilZ domain-containing protein [Planctomycetota bacterium]